MLERVETTVRCGHFFVSRAKLTTRIDGGDGGFGFDDDDDDDAGAFGFPDDNDTFDNGSQSMPPADVAEVDLLAATQDQPRRVRIERVNYAKKAKRVDVKRLKDNIWKGLDIPVIQEGQRDDDEMVRSAR